MHNYPLTVFHAVLSSGKLWLAQLMIVCPFLKMSLGGVTIARLYGL